MVERGEVEGIKKYVVMAAREGGFVHMEENKST